MTRYPFQPPAAVSTIPASVTFLLVVVLGLALLATSLSIGREADRIRSSLDASASDLGRAAMVRPAFAAAGDRS